MHIDRQAAIDAIDNCSVWVMYTQGDSQKDEAEFVESIIKQTKKTIQSMLMEDLPPAQSEPHWIPCTERLPERRNYYIVTDWGEVTEAYYNSDGCWFSVNDDKLKDVTAWMPLPEPYKERRKNDIRSL